MVHITLSKFILEGLTYDGRRGLRNFSSHLFTRQERTRKVSETYRYMLKSSSRTLYILFYHFYLWHSQTYSAFKLERPNTRVRSHELFRLAHASSYSESPCLLGWECPVGVASSIVSPGILVQYHLLVAFLCWQHCQTSSDSWLLALHDTACWWLAAAILISNVSQAVELIFDTRKDAVLHALLFGRLGHD